MRRTPSRSPRPPLTNKRGVWLRAPRAAARHVACPLGAYPPPKHTGRATVLSTLHRLRALDQRTGTKYIRAPGRSPRLPPPRERPESGRAGDEKPLRRNAGPAHDRAEPGDWCNGVYRLKTRRNGVDRPRTSGAVPEDDGGRNGVHRLKTGNNGVDRPKTVDAVPEGSGGHNWADRSKRETCQRGRLAQIRRGTGGRDATWLLRLHPRALPGPAPTRGTSLTRTGGTGVFVPGAVRAATS